MTDTPATAHPGLLWAYTVDGHGNGIPNNTYDSSATQWLHCQCNTLGIDQWLRDQAIDSSVVEALTANESRPRTLSLGGGTFIALRGVNKNPDAEIEDMISLRIWFTDSLVVTARKQNRKLLSAEDVRLGLDKGTGPANVNDLVLSLVEKLANRISEAVDSIDEQLTGLEVESTDAFTKNQRMTLADLRRQTAALRRYLTPQRDALDSFYRIRNLLNDSQAFFLREQTDRTTRYVEDIDLARERAILLQEENRNRIAEQQNLRMYVLSIVTAIFLPLSFLTGIFGMNVGGLPGIENSGAFWLLSGVMVVLAAALLAIMRWLKWF